MDAYIYEADLYCSDCIEEIKKNIPIEEVPEDTGDENTFDSDDYPKGPYPDGGGEADSPQHCAKCGIFLENDLTSDGMNWLYSTIIESLQTGKFCDEIFAWVDCYAIDIKDLITWSEERCECE